MRDLVYGVGLLAGATLMTMTACSSGTPPPSASSGSSAGVSAGSSGGASAGASSGESAGVTAGAGVSAGSSDTGSGSGSVSGTGAGGSGTSSGAPNVSGMNPDGGSSGGTDAGQLDSGGQDDNGEGGALGEAGLGCSSAGDQLCDDFEGVQPGATGSVWTIDNMGYTVETVTTMHHSGTHSVHVAAKGVSGRGYIVETKTFPATDFWGRAYLLLQAPGSGHEVFLAFDGAANEQVRVLNDLGSGKIATNRRSDDQSKQSSQAYPMGTWACYEWHETPTGLHVYLQGKELLDADETWTEAPLTDLRIGFERFDMGTGGDIYIDDVAVSSSQIGCN
jgi:hypothetical protein